MLGNSRTTIRKARAVAVAGTAIALVTAVVPAASAVGAQPSQDLRIKPFSVRVPGKNAAGPRAAAAALAPLRTFNGSFSSGGTTFPYTMVGTAPTGAATTSTIPNSITPLALRFGASTLGVPAANLTKVTTSGMYANKAFPGGTGQYGDVFMRTQFWTQLNGGAKNWHVKLAAPNVRPTLTLTVPAGSGRTLVLRGVTTGFADVNWLDNAIQGYISAPAPTILTQLLTNNIVLCDGAPLADLSNCGIGGYHSLATNAAGRHTYSYQSYLNQLIFQDPTFANISVMTHELAEWLADPYVNNRTPNWISAIAPQYGCNGFLEVGDPVVGRGMTIGGLFYQDEVYLSWFARQSPSQARLGRYTWFNSLTALSAACVP